MIVGTAADELTASEDSKDVELAVAYSTGSLVCGSDSDTILTNSDHPQRVHQASAGAFGSLFQLVTLKDIEECFDEVKVSFDARLNHIDRVLAEATELEKRKQELAECDERDKQLAAAIEKIRALEALQRTGEVRQATPDPATPLQIEVRARVMRHSRLRLTLPCVDGCLGWPALYALQIRTLANLVHLFLSDILQGSLLCDVIHCNVSSTV